MVESFLVIDEQKYSLKDFEDTINNFVLCSHVNSLDFTITPDDIIDAAKHLQKR